MKKNRLFVLGIITMFVAILSLTLVSGTMARYTSKVSGTSSATVAKWEFELNDVAVTNSAVATPQTITFDLFKATNLDTKDDNPETDVDQNKNLIAPGTKGEFVLKIDNLSQVNATYEIDYTVTNNDSIPVKFSVDGGANWTSSLADVAATAIDMLTGTDTITIQWEWPFDGDNHVDTELGLDGTATITVAIAVTFNQVD